MESDVAEREQARLSRHFSKKDAKVVIHTNKVRP